MNRFFIAAIAVTAACAPPTPAEVAKATSADVQALFREAVTTARYTNSMQTRDEFFRTIERMSGSTSSSRPEIPDVSSTDTTLNDWTTLLGRVFTDANVIDRPAGAIVFAVRGVDLCTPLRGGIASSGCVTDVDRLALAVRASAGVDLTLLVGPLKIEAATLRIRPKQSVALEVDLSQLAAVSAHLSQNQSLDGWSLSGQGKIEAKLQRNGDTDFTVSVSVLEDLSVRAIDKNGISRLFSTPKRTPFIDLRVEGPARRVTSKLDVGATEYQGLWSDTFGGSGAAASVTMLASLSGATWNAVFQDGQAKRITGLGLGSSESRLMFGGQKVFGFDFNERYGRAVDLELTMNGSGMPVVTAKPAAQGKLVFALQPVKNAGTTVDSNLLQATLEYGLLPANGAAPSLELVAPPQGRSSGALRVLTGLVSLAQLSSNEAPRTFVAGTCLQSFSGMSTNSQLDVFSSVPCP